ncbi:ATP-binding protein [Streptomyces bobili]|uniref:ATP-binding protein n=1 Tax=Streptomyces bobili TaxID=67280 RepID=UPI0033BA3007
MSTITAPPAHCPPRCVALARSRHAPAVARKVTARWLATDDTASTIAADVVLVVSELVTNTLRHTRGPCLLTLTTDGSVVEVAVTDTSEEPPRLHGTGCPGERGGYGIAMIVELGARVTVEPIPHGKTVHAALALRPDVGPGREAVTAHRPE